MIVILLKNHIWSNTVNYKKLLLKIIIFHSFFVNIFFLNGLNIIKKLMFDRQCIKSVLRNLFMDTEWLQAVCKKLMLIVRISYAIAGFNDWFVPTYTAGESFLRQFLNFDIQFAISEHSLIPTQFKSSLNSPNLKKQVILYNLNY
jgi:hypothetical protein